MTEQNELDNFPSISKLSEAVRIKSKHNVLLHTFLNDGLSLEDAKKLYDSYDENSKSNMLDVGFHPVTNRQIIYLIKERKVVYLDNMEETVPFEIVDGVNRIIRTKDRNSIVSECFLNALSNEYIKSSGIEKILLEIKRAFLDAKIKIVDEVVYTNEPIVYVFLNLIRSKSKRFSIKIDSFKYDKDAMKVFFNIYRNLIIVGKDEGFGTITPKSINVKHHYIYKESSLLAKRCELI